MPCFTASVRTFSWPSPWWPVVKTVLVRAAFSGRCCGYPLTEQEILRCAELLGVLLWVTEVVREKPKTLTHSLRCSLLPTSGRFCSLQGELDLLRIWQLLIGEFICIVKESPPAPSSNLSMFLLFQEIRNTCFKVFCLMTCHFLFSSATIKEMHSVSQPGMWRA